MKSQNDSQQQPEQVDSQSEVEQQDEVQELDDDLLEILESVEKVSMNDLFENEGIAVPSRGEGSIESPTLAYSLYHGTIEALLRKHLPKTTSEIVAERKIAKEIRRLKNLYLRDGVKRGADGKMAFNHRKAAVASEIVGWVNEYGGSNYAALHGRLVKLCLDADLNP